MLKGSGRDNEKSEDEETPTPQAADFVLEAVEEQQELLDAFAKLADEMSKLLVSFENSTFVKRLKAASRKQIDIAVDLNNLDSFGLDRTAALNNQSDRERLAERETNESEAVSTIIQRHGGLFRSPTLAELLACAFRDAGRTRSKSDTRHRKDD